MNVTEEKKTKCFVGTEAEGPNRGATVLFVPGSVENLPSVLGEIIKKSIFKKITRIYYGAGNDRNIRKFSVRLLTEFCIENELELDVEVDNDITGDTCASIIRDCGMRCSSFSIIRFRKSSDIFYYSNFDKYIIGDKIVWKNVSLDITYSTSVDDPLFGQDKYIEELE